GHREVLTLLRERAVAQRPGLDRVEPERPQRDQAERDDEEPEEETNAPVNEAHLRCDAARDRRGGRWRGCRLRSRGRGATAARGPRGGCGCCGGRRRGGGRCRRRRS